MRSIELQLMLQQNLLVSEQDKDAWWQDCRNMESLTEMLEHTQTHRWWLRAKLG